MVIKQCLIILVMFFLGTAIADLFHLPIPGNVLGFGLLFAALCGKAVKLHHVEKVSDHIVNNLALFFVVTIVGIMVHAELIEDQFVNIFLPLALSIVIGLFTAAKVTELLIRREKKKFLTGERARTGDIDDQ